MTIDLNMLQMQGRVPVTVLQPRGAIDASNYLDLIAAAQQAYTAGARDLLLDLGQVTYMSSSGIVALQSIGALVRGDALPDLESGWGALRAIDRDRDAGMQAHFKLLNPQPQVDRVLNTVGMTRYLQVFASLDEALASF
ncbi:MAG: STAS domain-containing protein [Anaerolineae bacterium]|nr:STAS domain-containing protein [Anaerolineae bacterium]